MMNFEPTRFAVMVNGAEVARHPTFGDANADARARNGHPFNGDAEVVRVGFSADFQPENPMKAANRFTPTP